MQHLYNIIAKKLKTNQGPRIWVLNIKYCPISMLGKDEVRVRYTYSEQVGARPFSIDAIRDIDKFSFKVFRQAYLEERSEILDHDAQDMRISAIWSFYKNVHKGDIMLLVTGTKVLCYYNVTGDNVEIENKEDSCEHFWQAECHSLDEYIEIKDRFGSPFFKLLDGKLGYQILDAINSMRTEG